MPLEVTLGRHPICKYSIRAKNTIKLPVLNRCATTQYPACPPQRALQSRPRSAAHRSQCVRSERTDRADDLKLPSSIRLHLTAPRRPRGVFASDARRMAPSYPAATSASCE